MGEAVYAEGDEEKVLGWVAQATHATALAYRSTRPAARVGVLGEWWRRASARDVLGAMGSSLHDLDAQSSGCAALTGLATDPSRCATLQSVSASVARAVLELMRSHDTVPRVQTAACVCIAVLAMDTMHRESLLSANAIEQLMTALRRHPLNGEVQQFAMAGLAVLIVENNGASARAKARGAGQLVSKALAKKHWGAQGCFVGHDAIQRFGGWLQQVFGAIAEPEPEPEPEPIASTLSPGEAERQAASLMALRREKLSRQQQDAPKALNWDVLDSPGPRKRQPESRSGSLGSVAPITHYLSSLPFEKAQASSDGVERNLLAKDREHAQHYVDKLHGTAVTKARGAGPSPEARRRYAKLRQASPPPKPMLFSTRAEDEDGQEVGTVEINSGLVIPPPPLPPAFGSRGKTSPADCKATNTSQSSSNQQSNLQNASDRFPIENRSLLEGNLLDGGYRVRPDAITGSPSPLRMRDPELYAILEPSTSNVNEQSSHKPATGGIEPESSLQNETVDAIPRRTVTLGGKNVKNTRAVLAAEQAAAEAELARKIAAEAERSYAMQAEAQQMQAEREQSAHAEAQKTAMLEFAESIGTNVQFEDDAAAENAEGLNQHKQSPPWKMTEMEPGANPLLQTDQLARELTDEVKSLRGRLEKASAGSLPRAQLRPKSAAAPTPSMLGPRLEMICDDLDALPVRPFSVVAFVGLLFILPVAPLVDTVSVGWHRLTQRKTPECPHGYQLRTFRVGDEEGWCACFHQWTAGPHESYTAAGWTPDRLDRWFNMAAGTNGGCGIRQPSRDLFLIERVHTEVDEEERDKASGSINENQSSSIVATACVWTTPSKTKKTLIERNGAKVVVAMPSTGEINWVASVDGHRGKGLGDVVTLAALQRLHELGYQSCWLETDDWRIPAIKTYFKYGFRKLLTHDSHTVRWETVEKMCRSGQIAPNVAPQLL